MQDLIEKLGAKQQQPMRIQNDGEKIVVHVKHDGTYQKTVERLPVANGRKKK
jgi:hypothetical protein